MAQRSAEMPIWCQSRQLGTQITESGTFKMSADSGPAVMLSCDGSFEAISPSLQNCIRFSSSGKYFSILCDFGSVSISLLEDTNNNLTVTLIKRLNFGKGELLEGHAWSNDDQVFAVAGHCKVYLFQVPNEFSRLHSIPLYYIPKDISLILEVDASSINKLYNLAVAGPNGVEIYSLEIGDGISTRVSSSLHADLAIALVQFSPDKKHLAVAALDGHFGIWSTASFDTDQKEFWFVHLKTIRITSIEFSPDSAMIAVAGWEGSWYAYKKTREAERFSWMEFHHEERSDKISGDLPGSFISWSLDNRFIRLTQFNENKVFLSTFDTQTSTATVTPLCGIVKGLASFRGSSGDYSLCFVRSKKCFAVPWPANQLAPTKSVAASKEETELLYHESLEGSVLVELSAEGEVTLRWRRISQQSRELLREMSNKIDAFAEEDQTCDEQFKTKHVVDGNDSKIKKEPTDGLFSPQGSNDGVSDAERHGEHSENVVTPFENNQCRRIDLSAIAVKSEKHVLERTRSFKTTDNKSKLLEGSLKFHDQGSPETLSQTTPVGLNMLTTSEEDGQISYSLERVQSSEESSGKGYPTTTKEKATANTKENIDKSSEDIFYVRAAFINPKLFQTSAGSPLLPGSSVKLLISTNCVAVVVLPLLAYVYQYRKEEWRVLLFRKAVKNCCIAEDKYLVLLSNDGRIRILCLQGMEELYSSQKAVIDVSTCGLERCMMSGNPCEPQFSIINLNSRGTRELHRIGIQYISGDRDACVLVNHLTVCFPDLLSHRPLSQLSGSIGHLMIFKHEESNQTTRGQKQQDFQLQWIVIVPELQIFRTFLEDRYCSLEGFVIRHHSDLMKLNSLALRQ
ncbi:uncharacterized protein [Montipora capricornis]|uniref:uncharacterized protein n=1 Tax=Montipora capricornis TaxID=246305 RepID=UPI0035F1E4DA